MKYFVVTSTIRDGEFEYLQQTPVMAETESDARLSVWNENEEWTKHDYREHEINKVTEIEESEYHIIRKYIF